MLRAIVVFSLIVLAGCQATAIKDVQSVNTKVFLNEQIKKPTNLKLAYYVKKGKPEQGVNFWGVLEEATELVGKEYFQEVSKLDSGKSHAYLLNLETNSRWSNGWGKWNTTVKASFLDQDGKLIYQTSTEGSASGAGPYDFAAVHNTFVKAVLEITIDFLNKRGNENLALAEQYYQTNKDVMPDISKLLPNIKPRNYGTGFFFGEPGQTLTAAHVIDECMKLEVSYQGKPYPAKLKADSLLLDLAVLESSAPNDMSLTLPTDRGVKLGRPIFVVGYPLAEILSTYPSLTVGNISSKGGLRGSSEHFQFSAPIQPGNSGSPVIDYQGNLRGLVTSTLNQKMMLEEKGNSAQNVNFAVNLNLLKKFLDKNEVNYSVADAQSNFEQASADATKYTNQILCYK
ncbi:MAG: serine protease [Cellvibrionaceae bacterium]|nr:serine protease [Cellvibrionaceae bacterium]